MNEEFAEQLRLHELKIGHYAKLIHLEEAMRKRLRVLRDLPILPDDRDWKIPEEIYETLRSLLSDAGLE